jgi:hypothetical protein
MTKYIDVTKSQRTITMPMTAQERAELETYCREHDAKIGAVALRAILKYIRKK